MAAVIKELRDITKMTKKEEALNQKIASTFDFSEQKQMYRIMQRLLEDELIHVMTLISLESATKSDLL